MQIIQLLKKLSNALLKWKRRLVQKIKKSRQREIFVIMDGGLVQEVMDVPDNFTITVLDYDTEGVDREDLKISPVDGELCLIDRW
jgi:excinuclease UvrABC helicase subunit UvrB